jgi:hypothetical protein
VGELEKGQTNSILGAGAKGVPQNNLYLEALSSDKDLFYPTTQKTVSKDVSGNHGYSIYSNLKFAFEAAKILGSPTLISFGELRSPQFYLRFHYPST